MTNGTLPTFVVAFDERQWSGTQAIIFLAPPTPLLTGSVDRRDRAVVDRVKSDLLARVNEFLSTMPSTHGDLPHMRTFLSAFAGLSPADMVITAEQERDDIGQYEPGWRDRISSLYVIGVPDSRTTFKLFEQPNQQSHELHVRLPGGHYAASYWTIHESAFQANFRSPPVVPDPGPAQGGRSASYPWKSFGNMAKSFRWDR